MSVITETRLVEYAGNGVTTSFPVPFRFLENAHVVATLIDDTTLVETVLALGTNYTLAGVGASTGTLTAIVAPGLSKTLRIERVVPITQTSLFPTQGPFSPAAYEKALDHQAMAVQQVREQTTQEAAAAALSAGSAASSAAASAASAASASAAASAAAAAVSAAAVPGSSTLVTATGSTTPRTLGEIGTDRVSAATFGIAGDSSDSTVGFQLMRTWLQSRPGREVFFPAGEYHYSDNALLKGVDSARLVGHGAKFKCIATTGNGVLDSAFSNGGGLWNTSTNYYSQPTYKFATASAGAVIITCLTPAEAANFQAGDDIFLCGYTIYPGGWPPSTRYFEWARVSSVNVGAGTITLERPLRHNYDQRWYDETDVGSGRLCAVPLGAPRVMCLSRRSPDFSWPSDFYFEGIEFLKGTNEGTSYFLPYARGAVYAQAAASITFNRCKIGCLVPSMAARVSLIDCEVDTSEIDKFVGRVSFDRTRVLRLVGGNGAEIFEVRDSEVVENLSASALETFSIRDSDIRSGDVSPFTGSKITAKARCVSIRDNRIHTRNQDPTATKLYNVTIDETAIVPAAAGAGYIHATVDRTVGSPTAYSPMMHVWIGNRIFTKTPHPICEGVISAIYWNGTYLVIEASFNRTPTVGDTFYVSPSRSLIIRGNISMGVNDLDALPIGSGHTEIQSPQLPYRAETVDWSDADNAGRSGRLVVRMPRTITTGLTTYILPPGRVVRVQYVVVDAAAGYTMNINQSGGAYWSHNINCATPGAREVTLTGVAGAVAGDALAALPNGDPPQQLLMSYSASPGTAPYPKGYLVIDYVNPPGGY